MKKLIKIILVLVLVLIVGGALAVHFFLNGAVKKAVETVGPQITKTTVKLDSVNIILLSGSGSIKGLDVGNPEGFKASSAIRLGKAKLALKPTSLLSDKVIVSAISVEEPEITFEQTLKGNNLLVLKNNLGSTSPAEEQQKEEAKEGKPGKKLQVDDFLFKGGKVHVFANLPTLGQKSVTVSLPEIHLTNLGSGTNGITPAELSRRVLDAVLAESIKAAEQAIADLAKGALILGREAGTNATGKAGKTLEGVGNLFKKKK